MNILRRLLQDWFRDQVDAAPAGDPRRTRLCLRFEELSHRAAGTLRLPAARHAHVEQCRWCRRAVEHYLAGETAPAEISISLRAQAKWPPELTEALARSLRRAARRDTTGPRAPAHFDDDGTLTIHWTGVEVEGSVVVSYVWQGTDVPLARGVSRKGVLEVKEPLPDLGLRNLDVPARAFRILPEETA